MKRTSLGLAEVFAWAAVAAIASVATILLLGPTQAKAAFPTYFWWGMETDVYCEPWGWWEKPAYM